MNNRPEGPNARENLAKGDRNGGLQPSIVVSRERDALVCVRGCAKWESILLVPVHVLIYDCLSKSEKTKLGRRHARHPIHTSMVFELDGSA